MGIAEIVRGQRAIIIDDIPEMAQFICDLCQASGLEAQRFPDAQSIDPQALRAANLIFLDLNLPGLDGVELMREFGRQRLKTPIILVSSHEDCTLQAAAAAGRECGLRIHGVLHKPFSIPQFERLVRSVEHGKPAVNDVEMVAPEVVIEALETNAIEPYFQPKIRLDRLEIVGFEALARLRLPNGQIAMPAQFIDTASEEGLLGKLTDRMLVLALDAWRDWSQKGFGWNVSVNVPASRLQDVRFPDQLEELYGLWGIERDGLILEITETELLDHYGNAMDTLARLAMKRVSLSIDDFGTGFSSLSQLKRLPCIEMKIDRSFIADIETNAHSEVIVRKSIELGRELGLMVTAEGIESQHQADLLRMMGCDLGQGFFFSRPEPRSRINATYIDGFAA
ncbi:MAG TPA: EAL domain-containing response regulator [Pseudomonadales bacterium]|nr:EAL domain-containing response regulator [Pseudomonadales bacterium]